MRNHRQISIVCFLVLFLNTLAWTQLNVPQNDLIDREKIIKPFNAQLDMLDLIFTLGPDPLPSGLNSEQIGKNTAQIGDVNNDGYADWAVGLPTAQDIETGKTGGTVHIYLGKDSLQSETRSDLVITSPEGGYNGIGSYLAGAGDVNQDGFDDLLVHCYWFDENSGFEERVLLYHGGSDMDLLPDRTFRMPPGNNVFGRCLAGAGDVNNDGFDDILISAPSSSGWPEIGRVYLYFGGADMDTTADVVFEGESEPTYGVVAYGTSISSAGDVNNDGYDDVIVGALSKVADGGGGAFHVYYGGNEMDNTADLTVHNITGSGFSTIVAGGGDFNNDGYDDLLAGAHLAGTVYVYYGGETVDDITDVTLTGGINGNQFEPLFLSNAGDVNGDEIDDVVFGLNHTGPGAAYVYHGGTPMDTIPDVVIFGDIVGDRFGWSVAGGGDIDKDGYCDVIVGSVGNFNTTGVDDDQGHIYIYRGGQTMDNEADAVFTGASAAGEGFGSSVACVGDVNNDDYPDILVGAPGYYDFPFYIGRAYLYLGSENPVNEPSLIYNSVREKLHANFGHIAPVGDYNSDGFDDFIIAESNSSLANRQVFLYLGRTDLDTIPDLDIRNIDMDIYYENMAGVGDVNDDGYDDFILVPDDQAFLYYGSEFPWRTPGLAFTNIRPSVSRAGDLNGDGISDFCISGARSADSSAVYVFFGDSALDAVPDLILRQELTGDLYELSLSGDGDINNDGYSDIVVGDPGYSLSDNSQEGRIYIYFGGETMDNVVDVVITGDARNSLLGTKLLVVPDLNLDGYDELLLSRSGMSDKAGLNILYGGDPPDSEVDINLPHNIGVDISLYRHPALSYVGIIIGDGKRVYIYANQTLLDISGNQTVPDAPKQYALYDNYPNPFNPVTTVGYYLAKPGQVALKVYDLLGRKVATLVDQYKPAGSHRIQFDASDLSSGIYFYTFKAGAFHATKKMMMLR